MRIFLILSLAAIGSALSACNTFIGMSRDVQAAGEGMEKVFRGETINTSTPPPPPPPMQ